MDVLQGISNPQNNFFLDQFWMTASNVWAWMDYSKYQILILQIQKVADEK